MLLGFLAATAIAIVRLDNLFAVVMLAGIYSLLSAGIFVELDAVDVAFTEAAVGAGISTIVMLGTLALTTDKESTPIKVKPTALIVVLVTGAAVIYGTLDMPILGDPSAPVHQHVAPRYIEASGREIGIPNIVTSVLASYRGYDTLGEVTVIFTAGIGVLMLLGGSLIRREAKAGIGQSDGGKDDKKETETKAKGKRREARSKGAGGGDDAAVKKAEAAKTADKPPEAKPGGEGSPDDGGEKKELEAKTADKPRESKTEAGGSSGEKKEDEAAIKEKPREAKTSRRRSGVRSRKKKAVEAKSGDKPRETKTSGASSGDKRGETKEEGPASKKGPSEADPKATAKKDADKP